MFKKVSQAPVAMASGPDATGLPDAGTPEFAQLGRQMQAAQAQFQQQQNATQQQPARRVELGGKSVDDLRMLSDILDDIQDQLEPIRDRVLDEKARLTGYAQCAEAFIKIIAARAAGIKKRAVEQAREERAAAAAAARAATEVPPSAPEEAAEAPAEARPKRRTAKKKVKQEEAKPGGHDSAEKQRGSS